MDKLQIKRGPRRYLPKTALEAEPMISIDTGELFIGINKKPVRIGAVYNIDGGDLDDRPTATVRRRIVGREF